LLLFVVVAVICCSNAHTEKTNQDDARWISIVKTNLLQFVLESSVCNCGDHFDYALDEQLGASLHLYMICKAGHVFTKTVDLQEYVSTTTHTHVHVHARAHTHTHTRARAHAQAHARTHTYTQPILTTIQSTPNSTARPESYTQGDILLSTPKPHQRAP
jgi:hypothetical protein